MTTNKMDNFYLLQRARRYNIITFMFPDTPSQTDSLTDKLLFYGAIGILAIMFMYFLYGMGFRLFGEQMIAAVSVFGTSVSSILTILVVVIYLKQTEILKEHKRELEEQSNLMSLDHMPDITVKDTEIDGDQMFLDIKNRGKGVGSKLELQSKIYETDGGTLNTYQGVTSLNRLASDGRRLDDQTIEANAEGNYCVEPTIEIEMQYGDPEICSFEEIIQSIYNEETQTIRIEMHIQPYLQNDEPAKEIPAFPNEANFEVDLTQINDKKIDCFKLENIHQNSLPA